MHESELKKLIDTLNKQPSDLISLIPISKNVEYAEVWDPIVLGDKLNVINGPSLMYFVKNDEGIYTSTVLEMRKRDLHVYTLTKFRRKGILKNALKNTILPHLFQTRTSQRITVNVNSLGLKKYNASIGLAKSLGFRVICKQNDDGEIELKIGRSKVNKFELTEDISYNMSEEKMIQLQNSINCHVLKLKHLESFVRMGFHRESSLNQFSKHIKALEKYSFRIEDAWYKVKNKQK